MIKRFIRLNSGYKNIGHKKGYVMKDENFYVFCVKKNIFTVRDERVFLRSSYSSMNLGEVLNIPYHEFMAYIMKNNNYGRVSAERLWNVLQGIKIILFDDIYLRG